MAVTQYIGARYVPIIADPIQWSNAISYEPLTIVTHQGNSYTSRQYVPIGIDISNDAFWALTGNYNAQIEQYREEVAAFADDIEELQNEIGDGFSSENTVANAIETETTNRENADTAITEIIGDGFTSENTVADNITRIETKMLSDKLITVEDYGAIGNGVFDCSTAIQQAIDENPNSTIYFRGGTYIITQTIFLNGDVGSTTLDLNGSSIVWNGSSSSWNEGNPVSLFANHEGIMSNPHVMLAIERRVTGYSTGRPHICNGSIDGNLKADICIQNVSFVPIFENLRIHDFMYAGIFNGTYDGQTYDMTGTVTSSSGRSTQMMIDSCYFVRAGDYSLRNTSAIFSTYPDNQIDNIVTNRTKYGITLRTGGHSISNSHITIQYESLPNISNFQGCSVRLWPLNAGATQYNIFENCYFNVGRYVFYTYKDSSQAFTGANLRTMACNCHYTYYSSAQYNVAWVGAWYGGLWYGAFIANECGCIYGDYVTFLPYYTPDIIPSIYVMRQCEWKFANTAPSHINGRLVDSSNLCDDEWQYFCNSSNPVPAEKYKRIARIHTLSPVGSNSDHIGGTIQIEFSARNGSIYKKAIIERSGDNYVVNLVDDIGSTSEKLYIQNAGISTLNGIAVDIFTYASTNITEPRYLKVSLSDLYAHVYMLPDAVNYESGNNKNVYDGASNLIEIF